MAPAPEPQLSNDEKRRLRRALAGAFTLDELKVVVSDALDVRLDAVVQVGSLDQTVFELIGWAQRQGRLGELIAGAVEAAPRNPQLQEFRSFWGARAAVSDQQAELLLSALMALPRETLVSVIQAALGLPGQSLLDGLTSRPAEAVAAEVSYHAYVAQSIPQLAGSLARVEMDDPQWRAVMAAMQDKPGPPPT